MAKNTNTAEVQVEAQVQTYNMEGADMPKLLEEHKTVSAVIRFLDAAGIKRGDIAKITGKRYQHVRNVLTQPLKKANA